MEVQSRVFMKTTASHQHQLGMETVGGLTEIYNFKTFLAI